MKILVGYDGSTNAEAAIDDLKRAGLPEKGEAVVISVAEQWIPTPTSYGGVDLHLTKSEDGPEQKAIMLAELGRKRLAENLPGWKVTQEARIGSPASAILEIADGVNPDLIVMGASGHSALGRMFLGSASQKVMTEARCSVRVARQLESPAEGPIRLAIGVDSSKGAEHTVAAVAARTWPAGTEVLLINADFPMPIIPPENMLGPIAQWITEERQNVRGALQKAEGTLRATGLTVNQVIVQGDPKQILWQEAENWKADCIFVGAKNLGFIDRFLIGSVSSAVATRAHCTVEVVRPKTAS